MKEKKDLNELAFGIVQQATKSNEPAHKDLISKIMAEMGRKGGLKAGIRKLSKEKRQQIARDAVNARWNKARAKKKS